MNLALRKAQEDCTESYLLTEGLKLERELNAANERIKRLEKAGDALLNAHHPLTEGNWQKAKEAKP
jgi:predicted nuclease with TOPRIM domain